MKILVPEDYSGAVDGSPTGTINQDIIYVSSSIK